MINRSINQENNHKAYTLNKRALDKMKQKLKGDKDKSTNII